MSTVVAAMLTLIGSRYSPAYAEAGTQSSSRSNSNQASKGNQAAALIDYAPFMRSLQHHIKETWKFLLKKDYHFGRTVVRFKVHPNGEISDVGIVTSTGNKQEDEAAILAVQKASPVDPLPAGAPPVVEVRFTFDRNAGNMMGSDVSMTSSAETAAAGADSKRLLALLDNHGIRALNAHEYNVAVEKFSAAWKLEPKDQTAMEGLSNAFLHIGLGSSGDEAIAALHSSLFVNPDNVNARDALTQALAAQGTDATKSDARIALATKALDAKHNVDAYVEYKEAMRLSADADVALKADSIYNAAKKELISITGPQPSAAFATQPAVPFIPSTSKEAAELNNEGVQAINRRDYSQAIEKLRKSLSIDPNYKFAQANLAIAYNNFALASPPDKAIELLHESILVNPLNETTRKNIKALLLSSAYSPAWITPIVEAGEQKLKDNPQSAAAHAALGHAYEMRGDCGFAEAEYREALHLDSNNLVAQTLLPQLPIWKRTIAEIAQLRQGDQLVAKKQYDEALMHYTVILSVDPNSFEVFDRLGTVFLAKGDVVRAKAAFTKALKFHPSDKIAADGIKKCTDPTQKIVAPATAH